MRLHDNKNNLDALDDDVILPSQDEDTMISYIVARIEECVTYRESILVPKLERLWDIYEAAPVSGQKNTPWDNSSNLSVALAGTFVDQFVAKHVNSLRSPTPFLSLSSYMPENTESVRALSDYLSWAERTFWKGQELVENFERDRCKIGTGIGYVGFVDLPFITRKSITDAPQVTGRVKHPAPRWIPREDFIITPGYDDIDVAPIIGHRSWVALDQLKKLVVEAQISINFDALSPTQKNTSDDFVIDDLVKTHEIYYISFRYDLDNDGYPEDYDAMFHFDSKQLLMYAPCKYAFGKRPYFYAPFVRQEGEFDGKGICEQIEHYQAEVSTIHNQRRDNATLANNVMLKGRPSAYLTEKSRWYPGKIWLTNDTSDIEILQMPTSYMSTVQDEAVTIGLAERRIGISDAALGRESTNTNRAAATTVITLMEQGAQRDDLSVTLARNAFLRYGELILESLQIYGLPDVESSTSPESILGAERGSLVRQLIQVQDTILGIVGVSIEVSTRAVNKEMQRQANERLYSLLIGHATQVTKFISLIYNPQSPPEVKQFFSATIIEAEKLLKRIVESSGTFDINNAFIGDTLTGGGPSGQMGSPQGGDDSAIYNGEGQSTNMQSFGSS